MSEQVFQRFVGGFQCCITQFVCEFVSFFLLCCQSLKYIDTVDVVLVCMYNTQNDMTAFG